MNIRDESKKAFPCDSRESSEFAGMDLRDYFAAAALNGLAAHIAGPKPRDGETPQHAHARVAFEYADEMMKARNK